MILSFLSDEPRAVVCAYSFSSCQSLILKRFAPMPSVDLAVSNWYFWTSANNIQRVHYTQNSVASATIEIRLTHIGQ